MSDNWVVQNLTNALETWNDKLSEIWLLITQSPENFKGGAIWSVIVSIHGALQAIGYALLVVFFVVGVMKTCGSFAEIKKPEHAVKLFVRFALAKGLISYGMELMLASAQYRTGRYFFDYECRRIWRSTADGIATGDYYSRRRMRLF